MLPLVDTYKAPVGEPKVVLVRSLLKVPVMLGHCPNITGTTYAGMLYGSTTGAFSYKKSQGMRCGHGSDYGFADMSFDASKSKSLYNKNSVQPKAFQVLIIIKI